MYTILIIMFKQASGAKEAGATAVIFVSASTTNRVPRTIVFGKYERIK